MTPSSEFGLKMNIFGGFDWLKAHKFLCRILIIFAINLCLMILVVNLYIVLVHCCIMLCTGVLYMVGLS